MHITNLGQFSSEYRYSLLPCFYVSTKPLTSSTCKNLGDILFQVKCSYSEKKEETLKRWGKTSSDVLRWCKFLKDAQSRLLMENIYTIKVLSEKARYKHVYDKYLVGKSCCFSLPDY